MLKKYTKDDFKFLNEWISDKDILFQFSGSDWLFPLTEDQIVQHQLKFPYRQFYIGYTLDHTPYAFGQIIWNEANTPRLGRILIGNLKERGNGLGQKFVKELIEECISIQPTNQIHLFVDERNIPAIRCYEKVGFKLIDEVPFIIEYNGLKKNIVKMTINI